MKTKMTKRVLGLLLLVALIPAVYISDSIAKDKDSGPSDTWLQAKLITTYALNQHLSAFDIHADVRERVAYLDGAVDSPIKKDLAGELAKSIEGIKSVKNNLVVDSSTAPDTLRERVEAKARSFGQMVDDLTTTATIKTKLLADQNVKGFSINVDTERNHVTLSGEVGSDIERDLAGKLAANTAGVKDVTNLLQIEKKNL